MKMGEKLLSALPWLKPLLETEFYRLCGCKSLKQCNFYCTECMGSPFCEDCNNDPLKHEGHIYLRVYKSSSRPGIRIRSIKNLLDVSDIQHYICNSSKIVYIKRKIRKQDLQYETSTVLRPNSNNGRKGDKCEVCGYEIQCSASKFCSIECKVNGEMMDSEEETNSEEEDVDPTSIDDQLTCQPDVQANPNSLRKRNRKGNPNRAPFS